MEQVKKGVLNLIDRPNAAGTQAPRRGVALQTKITLSYSVLLLLCFALGVWLYCMSSTNAENEFWRQRKMNLENSVTVMEQHLATLDSYTRQLMTDSTFIRFSNMKSNKETGFFYTAYAVKETLAARLFSVVNLPVTESHIYLKNTGYVISASQFTEVKQFYKDYMHYAPDGYDAWMTMLTSAGGKASMVDATLYSTEKDIYWLVRDVDAIMGRSVPAVIWVEWDTQKLREQFLTATPAQGAFAMLLDEDGAPIMRLFSEHTDAQTAQHVLDNPEITSFNGMHVMRCTSQKNGWQYVMALPESMCAETLGNYDVLFLFMAILVLLGAAALTVVLVRQNMRPIRQLGHQLQEAKIDNAHLQDEMDSQRPLICATYVRRVLSGHIASEEEFNYTMRYLRLDGKLRFLVLYGVIYNQSGGHSDPMRMYQLLEEKFPSYLQGDHPLYFYTTLDHAYVLLLAYDESVADPLMDLQRRVVALHDDLLSEESLWFYGGVGVLCGEPMKLWESYEQARTAARYSAKHYVFVPYEMIHKESGSVYYPVEISAKLQHFISTGNKPQVTEMFALIHHENVEERSLPVNRLNFLLSDLKNTLLRARFQVTAQTEEERHRLDGIDARLGELPTFPLCEAIALELCSFFTGSAEPSDPIPEVRNYLRDNFADPSLCLSKLSDVFHISESYLSHMFKERTGQNFSAYLEEIRMREAERLLKAGMRDDHGVEISLNNLYMSLGYNNATSFRRAFKKRFGITPSEMRDSAVAAKA